MSALFCKGQSVDNEKIHIVFAADENYVAYVASTIASVISNTQRDVYFYLLDCGITKESADLLRNWPLIAERIKIISVKISLFEKYQCPLYWTSAIFYRLAIPDIFQKLDKAIYMDCDMICLGDIGKIWDMDISQHYIGAVAWDDHCKSRESLAIRQRKSKTKIPHLKKYYNAGLLLMNLKKIKRI